MYLKVAFRVNSLTRSTIESHESARDVISITMSEKRFEFISRFIIFDKKNSREERWKSGKFACLRELLEQINENVWNILMNGNNALWRNPSELLAIDEILYHHRWTIGFKQYKDSKPAKYYIEVYTIQLRPILTLHYHMLVNQKILKFLHTSNILQERMNLQNILSMRFQSTRVLREVIFRYIDISRQYR